MLMEQTELLLRPQTARDRHTVYVRDVGGGLYDAAKADWDVKEG